VDDDDVDVDEDRAARASSMNGPTASNVIAGVGPASRDVLVLAAAAAAAVARATLATLTRRC
jgi:hypothetical protein